LPKTHEGIFLGLTLTAINTLNLEGNF